MQTKVIRNLGCRATIVREPTTAQKSDTKPGGWVASFYKLHHAHRIYVHPPRKKVVNPFYKHCHLPKAHRICAHPPREKMVNPFYEPFHLPKPIVFVHTLPTILILYTIPLHPIVSDCICSHPPLRAVNQWKKGMTLTLFKVQTCPNKSKQYSHQNKQGSTTAMDEHGGTCRPAPPTTLPF